MSATHTTAPSRAAAVASHKVDCGDLPVEAHLSRFAPADSAHELHFVIVPTRYADVATQLSWLAQAYETALCAQATDASSAVLRRLFCSDPMNQADALAASPLARRGEGGRACAVSIVGQPPVAPAKVALWAYHLVDPIQPLRKRDDGHTLAIHRGALTHHWSTGLTAPSPGSSHAQTHALLTDYCRYLREHDMALDTHVARTWFFVRDIDVNYQGLVDARRALFATHGLTAETHFIASSGIGGQCARADRSVMMEAYAIAGLRPEQVAYIKAADHLSPTSLYGVTFERATRIDYRDRSHTIVSGTASIDADGRIVHEGDVARQLDRTLENIDALLGEAGAAMGDANSWIVYLRDPSDAPLVARCMRERIGDAPMALVAAPVCRPGWLVEVECLATTAAGHPDLPCF